MSENKEEQSWEYEALAAQKVVLMQALRFAATFQTNELYERAGGDGAYTSYGELYMEAEDLIQAIAKVNHWL